MTFVIDVVGCVYGSFIRQFVKYLLIDVARHVVTCDVNQHCHWQWQMWLRTSRSDVRRQSTNNLKIKKGYASLRDVRCRLTCRVILNFYVNVKTPFFIPFNIIFFNTSKKLQMHTNITFSTLLNIMTHFIILYYCLCCHLLTKSKISAYLYWYRYSLFFFGGRSSYVTIILYILYSFII